MSLMMKRQVKTKKLDRAGSKPHCAAIYAHHNYHAARCACQRIRLLMFWESKVATACAGANQARCDSCYLPVALLMRPTIESFITNKHGGMGSSTPEVPMWIPMNMLGLHSMPAADPNMPS